MDVYVDGSSSNLFITLCYYFSVGLLISLLLASLGISVGFRTLYVNLLLKIFDVN